MRTLIINDPIHHVMDFPSSDKFSFYQIIDHPLFQRLRHIKQLGMADLVFPGAVHTRFNHSLGAAHLANRILNQTLSTSKAEKWRWIVTLTALLHDIGHGPFSHAFERLTKIDALNPINHEDWTPLFLNEIMDSNQSEFLSMTQHIITKSKNHDSKHNDSKHNDSKHHDPELQFAADIISSQVDADRLDYLLRDSHFCGVSYGKYDLNWLLHCMTAVQDDQNHLRLGITAKGVGAVEGLLMARRLMTQNVYHHPTINLLQTFMILFLGECCLSIDDAAMQNHCPFALKKFLTGLKLYRNAHLTKTEFMQTYFSAYQTLTDHLIYQWIETAVSERDRLPKNIVNIAERLFHRKLPKLYKIPKNKEEGLKSSVAQLCEQYQYEHWQLGFQEVKFTTYQDTTEAILVKDKGIAKISQSSFLMNTFADQHESFLYLYIDKSIATAPAITKLLNSFA